MSDIEASGRNFDDKSFPSWDDGCPWFVSSLERSLAVLDEDAISVLIRG